LHERAADADDFVGVAGADLSVLGGEVVHWYWAPPEEVLEVTGTEELVVVAAEDDGRALGCGDDFGGVDAGDGNGGESAADE
jgi:hypothetical protein